MLAASIKNDLETKNEALPLLTQVIKLFEDYLQSPETFIDPKKQPYFFGEFSKDIILTISKQWSYKSPEVILRTDYAVSIRKLYKDYL